MIYIISLAVFSGIIFVLVSLLLFVENRVVKQGDCTIVINEDEENAITVKAGTTLLSALAGEKIFLPSACGGGGSCGTCRCKVTAGGRDILPTEQPHLTRAEKKQNIRLACQVKVKEDMRIQIPESIFNIKKYPATVVSNESVATFIKELVLQLDNGEKLDFEAGAYVQIDIPQYQARFSDFEIAEKYKPVWNRFKLWSLEAGTDEPALRAYSLANPPHEGDILKFTIRIATPPPGKEAPPGVGSSYVFNLKPGDKVTLSGPYGDFRVKEGERELCFIGGGAGMAPLRSQILDQLLGAGTERTITYWYGARSKSEIFYEEAFRQLEAQFDNFSFYIALSDPQPEDDWDGMTGFIHQCAYEHYLKDHPDPSEVEYYLCGPPVMIDAVISMLDSLGVEPEMIAYDKFS